MHPEGSKRGLDLDWGLIEMPDVPSFADPKRPAMEDGVRNNHLPVLEQPPDNYAAWEHQALRSVPGNSYSGPHLHLPIAVPFIDELVAHYTRSSSPTAEPLHLSYLVRLLLALRDSLMPLPRLTRIESQSGNHQKLVVVGDLHGQLADLLTIFAENGYPHPQGPQYLFNGDFVDRGIHGVEVTTILFAFKLLYPDSVHLNRGNHENPDMNYFYGFADEVMVKYKSMYLLDLYHQVFLNLPVATLVDGDILVLHGGLFKSDNVTLADIDHIPRAVCNIESFAPEDALLCDILWNDPQEEPGRQPGFRGGQSVDFGPDVTEDFVRRNNLRLVVRSHQVPSNNSGIEMHHGDKLMTLFSASNYCGVQGNQGAVMIIEGPQVYYFKEFWAPDLAALQDCNTPSSCTPISSPTISPRPGADADSPADLPRRIRELSAAHRHDLENYWESLAVPGSRRITVEQWGSGLYLATGLQLDYRSLVGGLAAVDAAGFVDYGAFLAQCAAPRRPSLPAAPALQPLRRELHEKVVALKLKMKDIFAIFDPKQDGVLPPTVLRAGCAQLGVSISLAEAEELLLPLRSAAGEVRVVDFVRSLQPDGHGSPKGPRASRSSAEGVIQAFGEWLGRCDTLLMEKFRFLDSSGDGQLTFEDFLMAMHMFVDETGDKQVDLLDNALLERVFLALDKDKSGTLSYVEFTEPLVRPSFAPKVDDLKVQQPVGASAFANRMTLKEAFYALDVDGDGLLSRQEFETGLELLQVVVPDSPTADDLKLIAEDLYIEQHPISWYQFLEAFTVREAGRPAPLNLPVDLAAGRGDLAVAQPLSPNFRAMSPKFVSPRRKGGNWFRPPPLDVNPAKPAAAPLFSPPRYLQSPPRHLVLVPPKHEFSGHQRPWPSTPIPPACDGADPQSPNKFPE
eukprot:EG_transcript_832